MIYFLCPSYSAYPDIQTLCQQTGWGILHKRGFDLYLNGKKQKITWAIDNDFGKDLAIRWGGKFTVPIKTINSPRAVTLAAHKKRSREFLQKYLPTPKTWFNLKDAQVPFIARPSTHSGGSDFHIVRDKKNLSLPRRDWYYSEIIDSKEEYRVYVGLGKVLGAYKKQFKEGEIRANRAITGMSWGELIQAPEKASNLAVRACEILGLDTGGVDILGEKVIEINSTPTISNSYTRDMYIKFIKSIK